MFALLGLAEEIVLLIMDGISAPLLARRRGGPVLVPRRFTVTERGKNVSPAVSIEARQSGLIPRLLALVGFDRTATLEVTEDLITFRRGGVWREERAIPLSQFAGAQTIESQPVWHLSAIGVIAALVFVYGVSGRLTLQAFGASVVLAAVCGVLCSLQRTIELIIQSRGGTTITLTFTALSMRRGVDTLTDVIAAAKRITELGMLKQQRAGF